MEKLSSKRPSRARSRIGSALSALTIEYLAVTEIRPNPINARRHPQKQIAMLAASIRAFGFIGPVVIKEDNSLLAGHARLEAARAVGLERVPCVKASHLSEAQARAYMLADNRMAELAEWDDKSVAAELRFLESYGIDFSIELTGFTTAEIDFRLEQDDGSPGKPDPADDFDPAPAAFPVTKPGDLWALGESRLLCDDALKPDSYVRLLGEAKADMAFTDPPYNVRIDGNVSGLGKVKHREFAMASGEMSRKDYTGFLTSACQNLATFTKPGSVHFVCMDWRHLAEMQEAGERAFSELLNLCVWNKTNAGMGSLYRSKHELVFVWKSGTAPHINNVQLGRHGRHRTNVWDYAGANSFGRDRSAALGMHPTVKPVALVADAIRDCSKRGGLVLDPFAGSGTTILAAERARRRAAAIEIDPGYVDTAIRRWQALSGKQAFQPETGLSFNEIQTLARERPAIPSDPDQGEDGDPEAGS